jgi:DNA-binding CsgD family transcriptional regulator
MPKLRRRMLLRELLDGFGMPPPGSRAWLDVVTWRLESAIAVDEATLLQAVQCAHRLDDLDGATILARAAWLQGGSVDAAATFAAVLHTAGRHQEAQRTLDEAEQRHGPGHQPLVLGRARGHILQARFDEADALVAQDRTDGGALCRAIIAYYRGNFARSHDGCRRLLDEGDPAGRAEAATFAVAALTRMGRPTDAVRLAERVRTGLSPTDETRDELMAINGMSFRETMAAAVAMAGDLHRAHRMLLDDMLLGEHEPAEHPAGPPGPAAMHRRITLGGVLLDLGRSRDALHVLRNAGFHRANWEISRRRARIGTLLARAATPEDASDVAELGADRLEPPFVTQQLIVQAWFARRHSGDHEVTTALTRAAEVAMGAGAFGDVAVVVHHMGRLGVAGGARRWWDVPVQGALLQARLDYTKALATGHADLLTEAGKAFESAGARLYAAEAFHELASLNVRLKQRRAAAFAAHYARSLHADCQGALTPPLLFPNEAIPLSRREREIATLVVQGLSDRAIAERLILSVRTVQNHMYRVYQKLGVKGRQGLRESPGLRSAWQDAERR